MPSAPKSEPVESQLDQQGRPALRRRHRRRHRRAGVHHREHERRRPAGVPDVPGRDRVGPAARRWATIGTFNPALLVHGQQAVTLHRPIPVEGTATLDERDHRHVRQGQGGGRRHRDDRRDGRRAAVHQHARRRSSAARAAGAATAARRARRTSRRSATPDHEVTYQTSPDQAFVYRLSGDRNPLHTDPSFAAIGGFDRPILHGLCSYGFTGRALLHTLCGSDPARFHHIEARFASPVLPGEALTVRHVGDRRRRGRVHDVRRRPRRDRPGPARTPDPARPTVVVPVIGRDRPDRAPDRQPVRTAMTATRWATTSARGTSARSPVRRSLTSTSGVLVGEAAADDDDRRDADQLGVLELDAGRDADRGRRAAPAARPPRASAASALGGRPLRAAGLAGDHDVDVGRRDLARPAQAELVVASPRRSPPRPATRRCRTSPSSTVTGLPFWSSTVRPSASAYLRPSWKMWPISMPRAISSGAPQTGQGSPSTHLGGVDHAVGA